MVHAKGIRKSLAGLLKYCIEERHVLSSEILRHSYRELLRDVFNLEGVKIITIKSGEEPTSPEYTKYRPFYQFYQFEIGQQAVARLGNPMVTQAPWGAEHCFITLL